MASPSSLPFILLIPLKPFSFPMGDSPLVSRFLFLVYIHEMPVIFLLKGSKPFPFSLV